MPDQPASIQRSFRLSASTSELLDDLAARSNESRNSLVERLLSEGVRLERHPLVRFRTGRAGRREPAIVGTRLLVRQLVSSIRGEEGNASVVAEALEIPEEWVRAAVAYYAEFSKEIDADAAWAAAVEARERVLVERESAALR
jgi:uncharacterized protein (DUF433 family)